MSNQLSAFVQRLSGDFELQKDVAILESFAEVADFAASLGFSVSEHELTDWSYTRIVPKLSLVENEFSEVAGVRRLKGCTCCTSQTSNDCTTKT